jgi:hypothetical protein
MTNVNSGGSLLDELARKYIWWKLPENAVPSDHRVVAQVMNIGDYQDVLRMIEALGEPTLRSVLAAVSPGELSEKSWTYWHYRLGMTHPSQNVPPLPRRQFS